jgi:Protein of unknown function (DUF2934)
MPRRGRRMGSDATALRESPEAMSGDAAQMTPDQSTVGESVKTAATVSPTECEIATVAYQLWLDMGCPAGSDQEDWFRAEAMLKNALVAQCEDLSKRSSIPRRDPRSESEMLVEFLWAEGHWEIWESEWGGARWVSDSGHSSFEVSNRAA